MFYKGTDLKVALLILLDVDTSDALWLDFLELVALGEAAADVFLGLVLLPNVADDLLETLFAFGILFNWPICL